MALIDRSSSIQSNGVLDLDCRLSAAVATIKQALVELGLPGVVVGITDRTQLRQVIAHGHADLKTNELLAEDSRLAIGSVSKSFTAIALLQLAEEGRLDLHAPITNYLPGLAIRSPFAPITAHHLITHTSGLPSYLSHAASSRYAIAALQDFVPSYAPGAHWWYSNTGYQLLGYVLEDLVKLPYPAIIRRRILDPLRMDSTCAILDDAQRNRMATSYARWPYDGKYLEAPWFEYAAGDGSLVSTIHDLCKYARFMLNYGRGPTTRLLGEQAFSTLTTSVLQDYGYGLFVTRGNRGTVVGHPGGIAGFRCLLDVHLEEGFGVALLSTSTIDFDLQKWIVSTLTDAFSRTDSPPAHARPKAWKSEVTDYAGTYYSACVDHMAPRYTLEFAVVKGCLALKEGNGFRPLQQMGGDCFRITDSNSNELPFFFGRAGEATETQVVEVSQGSLWYTTKEFPGQIRSAAPAEYGAYVGHFENNGPEGPTARIFVRNGQLWAMMAIADGVKPTLLQPLADGLFRLGEEEHSPERMRFDTFIDGQALRISLSGVPLYRRDTP